MQMDLCLFFFLFDYMTKLSSTFHSQCKHRFRCGVLRLFFREKISNLASVLEKWLLTIGEKLYEKIDKENVFMVGSFIRTE